MVDSFVPPSARELRYLHRNYLQLIDSSHSASLGEHSNESDDSSRNSDTLNESTMATTYNFDLFTPWDAKFLDPMDSTLSKLLVKESTFNDKKEKYNLEPKLFESYRLVL